MDHLHNPAASWNGLLELLAPLTAFAAKLFLQEDISGRDDILPATGKSPRGLAFDVITKYIEGEMRFRARSPETYQKDLYNFLKIALHHDFLDLIKGHEYQKTEVIDAKEVGEREEKALVLEDFEDTKSAGGFYNFEAAMLARKVLPLVEDDPELKELVEAILCLGCTKREDIAEVLGITPQEVTTRKHRLRVRLASWRRSVHASRKVATTHG
jgi:hypothetical protein